MKHTAWKGIDPPLVWAHDEQAPAVLSVRADSETSGWPDSLGMRNDTLPDTARNFDPRRRPAGLR